MIRFIFNRFVKRKEKERDNPNSVLRWHRRFQIDVPRRILNFISVVRSGWIRFTTSFGSKLFSNRSQTTRRTTPRLQNSKGDSSFPKTASMDGLDCSRRFTKNCQTRLYTWICIRCAKRSMRSFRV